MKRTLFALFLTIACLIALMQTASAATLDEIYSYDIIGSLQEKISVQRLNVVDIDNSGIPEILVVTSGKSGTPNTELKNSIYVFNSNGSIRWRHNAEREIYGTLLKDVNNDLNIETILSFGLMLDNVPRGTIQVLDRNGDTAQQFSRASLMTTLYSDDLNGDKYYELMLGSNSKLMLLYTDGDRLWEFPKEDDGLLNYSVSSISSIDINNDGDKEILYGSAGVYMVDLYGNFVCGYEVDTEVDSLKRQVTFLSPAKLGATETPDIIAVTSNNRIYALEMAKGLKTMGTSDGKKIITAEFSKKWVYEFYNTINSVRISDIDSDGYDEILVANEDGNMYAIDNTGYTYWTFRLDGAGKDFDLADVEKDNQTDIIIASGSGSIYSLDTKGNFLWKQDTDLNPLKVSAGDIDADAMDEIAVLTEEPTLHVFKLNQSFIMQVQADNLYATGERLFLVSSYEESREYLLRARDLYDKIGSSYDRRKAQSLIDRIDVKLSEETRQMADTYYDKARDFYISGDYEKARKYVAMAKQIYMEFGESESVLKCELLEMRIGTVVIETTLPPVSTTEAKNQTTGEPTDLNLGKLMAVGAVIIILLAAILYLRKKKESEFYSPAKDSESKPGSKGV